MEVYWYAERNGINDFYVKVTEGSLIDLPMTLRLFNKIQFYNLCPSGFWYAYHKRIKNFNVKVTERSLIDLHVIQHEVRYPSIIT